MAKPLVQEQNILEKGVIMYDSFLQDDILVVAPVLCIICDNPRASGITNNLGPGSRLFCRMCMEL